LNRTTEDLVVTKKLIIGAVGGVLVAAAMSGCAPKGQNNQYGSAGQNPALANATGEPTKAPDPSATPSTAANNAKAVGKPVTELKATAIPRMGKSVTDSEGFVLYRFDGDKVKPTQTNCIDKCAKVWPPATTTGDPKLTGVDASLVGTITRPDGATQITLAGWPLYYYIGDKQPGKWTGQNVAAKWFVSAPDGKKNTTCLPQPPPAAVAPPADDAGADASSNANNNNGDSNYSY
jgi:predicted lipoprotein with Yx(FWY)xxD motif